MVYQVKDKADFDAKLQEAGDQLVVVDFYATWCGPCKAIAPKVVDLSKANPDVVFLKVDVDECEDVATHYSVSCMPTFMFFKNGQKIEDFSGANEAMLVSKIAELK